MDFLEDLAGSPDKPITEADIRQIHYLVLKSIDDSNAGKYRSVTVEISGSEFKPPVPESVPSEMHEFGRWLAAVSSIGESYGFPEVILHAAAHTWFVYIHPFIDGNGRVARLLMNLLLMRYGYPIAIITKEDRLRYYDALELSQTADLSPFVALVTECVSESLEEYEEAVKEKQEQEEWAAALALRFSHKEAVQSKNEYEVWKSAMELLRSYFRQAAELLNKSAPTGKIRFRDFGGLEYEKYLSLKSDESAKKPWFFRVNFFRGERSARYLFLFGSPSRHLRDRTDVTLHLLREEPPESSHYERLEHIDTPDVPSIVEIGYHPEAERFVVRGRSGQGKMDKIENIGRNFFEEVISLHFQA